MKKLLIIGGGFAGLWSAISAKRYLRRINKEHEVNISLINKDEFHGLRPRFYEEDLTHTRIPLNDYFSPLNIDLIIGQVDSIDHTQKKITLLDKSSHCYDSLILAAGSQLRIPEISGLIEYGFNIDTYQAAIKLKEHIKNLPHRTGKGRFTILVIGGGFTGVEAATDLMDRLKKLSKNGESPRVIVIDRTEVASQFSNEMRDIILTAFDDLGIETRSNMKIKKITADHVDFESGEIIDAHTTVWTAGMEYNLLTKQFNSPLDRHGRLLVDKYLKIPEVENILAAGDVAAAMTMKLISLCFLVNMQCLKGVSRVIMQLLNYLIYHLFHTNKKYIRHAWT